MHSIVYVVYHDLNKEARSMEMLKCCITLGDVHLVSYATPKIEEDINTYIIDKASPIALLQFLSQAKKVILSVKPNIVVLHDSDCSILIPFVRKHLPGTFIVYDSSELYIKKQVEGVRAKRFCFDDGILIWIKQKLTRFRSLNEKKYLKDVDLVFAANQERAKIMEEYFELREEPTVFDNMHRIDDTYDLEECGKKFDRFFDFDSFNILFGGGISEERKTFDYIREFAKVREKANLIIVGSASNAAKTVYDDLISELELMDKVHYLGFVSRAELRYIMQKSQASVVLFDMNSYNTIYCESGKCYESLFEGTPILASENPPLFRLCSENKIGVSDNNFSRGILTLMNDYDNYQEHVKDFISGVDYEGRIDRLSECILKRMNQ